MTFVALPCIDVTASELDAAIDDDEITFLFVRWGPAGQYLDITRACGQGGTYLEFCDQGAGFFPHNIQIGVADDILTVQVGPSQTLGPQVHESCIHINLGDIPADRNLLQACASLLSSQEKTAKRPLM